ncbi:DUF3037 domain-containing protein [Pseudomonas sp. dw_358]|uniref:DUF3037 domain-containing protein n=1 Tax=Pseudomonas sp. dw_358 TaxID=2720083 RepID=UPI001BD3AFA6|nr:DUF3037 domain-containing protein [Pseudomonas sp. dw_358]
MTILARLKERTAKAESRPRVEGHWQAVQMCLDQDTGEYLNVGVLFSHQDQLEVRMLDVFDRVKCLYGKRVSVKDLNYYLNDVEEYIFASRKNLPDQISSNVRLSPKLYAAGESPESVVSDFFDDIVTLGKDKGAPKNDAFRYTSTPKLRDSLFQIMRQKMDLSASAIIKEERYRLRLKNGTIDVDAPLLSSTAVGSVISVWYKSPVVAEKNILQASSDLGLVTSNTDRAGSLSILVPTEKSGMDHLEFRRVSEVIEKQLDRLERSGIEVIRAPSTDELAAKTIDWWQHRVA